MYDYPVIDVVKVIDCNTVRVVLDLGFHASYTTNLDLAGVEGISIYAAADDTELEIARAQKDLLEALLVENPGLIAHAYKNTDKGFGSYRAVLYGRPDGEDTHLHINAELQKRINET